MLQFHFSAPHSNKMNIKEDPTPKSILHGNEAFVRKILSTKPIGDQSLRRDYFSDKQSRIPFNWEEEPGIPKHSPSHDFVPPISPPPPSNWRPSKPAFRTQPKSSCFFMQPWRIHKGKKPLMMLKGNQGDDDVVHGSHERHRLSSSSSSSSPRVSESSSMSPARDSSASVSSSMSSARDSRASSSKLLSFAKGFHKWLF